MVIDSKHPNESFDSNSFSSELTQYFVSSSNGYETMIAVAAKHFRSFRKYNTLSSGFIRLTFLFSKELKPWIVKPKFFVIL